MTTPKENLCDFKVGDCVEKIDGDYKYKGFVVAAFVKRNGWAARYVVENADGMLFIFSTRNLKLVKP